MTDDFSSRAIEARHARRPAFGEGGPVIGLATAILVLVSGRGANLNMRAAFLKVVNDTLGSVAVLVAAAVIATSGWLQADAVASLVIAALIIPRTLKLLKESVDVLLVSTPKGLQHPVSSSRHLTAHRSARRAGNTVRSTVPAAAEQYLSARAV